MRSSFRSFPPGRLARGSGPVLRRSCSAGTAMSMVAPGTVFVSWITGKRRCEEEATHFDDVEQGANVLLQAALRLAEPA